MIAFISDIHGNYFALKAVLDKIEEMKCDVIYSLGDIAGYYCMINECIALLRAKNVINILGNHDDYLLNGYPKYLDSKTVKLCIDYQKKVIKKDNLMWLQNSKHFYDNSFLSLRHAGWVNIREERFIEFDFQKVKNYTQTFFISGHSHIQMLIKNEDKIYCNPGSVGQPRDGNSKAAFAILDKDGIRLMRVSYDIDKIVDAMKKNNFGEWIYKGLYIGKGV